MSQGYTKALDIWSVGCILGEMINNRPMFPGKHYLDQICKIQEVLGTPSKEDLSFISNPKAQLYVNSLPLRPSVAWAEKYPNANERLDETSANILVNFVYNFRLLDILHKLLGWLKIYNNYPFYQIYFSI